jgi:hypothetical protein
MKVSEVVCALKEFRVLKVRQVSKISSGWACWLKPVILRDRDLRPCPDKK